MYVEAEKVFPFQQEMSDAFFMKSKAFWQHQELTAYH